MEEKERQRKNKIKELNKNQKCSKNEKSRKISSDDEIEYVSVSDEALVEIDSSEEDFDVDDVIVLDRNFLVNNFVLVKFNTKKTVYH